MVNDTWISVVKKLDQVVLDERQQASLFQKIGDLFSNAIDARSPKKRPPGKAGFKAEKGYFRLLYLESEFQNKMLSRGAEKGDGLVYDWSRISEIFEQLEDLPEVRSEFSAGIEAALQAVMDQ